MSFVLDSVRRIDAQLDRLQLTTFTSSSSSTLSRTSTQSQAHRHDQNNGIPPRLLALQASTRLLSAAGATDESTLLQPWRIRGALEAITAVSTQDQTDGTASSQDKDEYEEELEWLVVSKATTLTYGLVVKTILDQAVSLADDLWYWDEVSSSQRWTAVYSVQTSPIRLWHWSYAIWSDVKARGGHFSIRDARQDASDTISARWQEFYGLVKRVIEDRSIAQFQKQALSPLIRLRTEMKQKQTKLKRARLRYANALGVLLGEGLANESAHGQGLATPSGEEVTRKWKENVTRNIALMGAVLTKVHDEDVSVDKFDSTVAELTNDDTLSSEEVFSTQGQTTSPEVMADRINALLSTHLTAYTQAAGQIRIKYGRPGRLIRYWPAITIAILSSSTILRLLANRQAEIVQWIRDLGTTTIDFWQNWVIEPLSKVIKTIRHDEESQLSLMSKRSLEGDRDSLERMVVDFAIDNPQNATGPSSKLSEAQIADIRLKVKEGDLTPVLKAYERDLRSPFMGTIRGDLIRALLIQIQKTKVDVEVAIGGIDNLLKSQELVFGFVGLTPGILVTYFAVRYIRDSFSEKRGSRAARKQGKLTRQLRNIDRILSKSLPTDFGELYYKDQGLLLCDAHVLREQAKRGMPTSVFRDFSEDVEELCDVRTGLEGQRRVLERLRWAYAKYI